MLEQSPSSTGEEPVRPTGAEFFPGHGEMSRRMREFDWAAHPLGRPETWPVALRTAIRIMLTSRFAMWLGWGPEFYFFCNDAYRPTLGLKETWALGAPAPRVWEEVWDDVGPRAESVLRGEATWDESLLLFLERSGFSEETYHTFSYSPVLGEDGRAGGLLCVVTEETERVIGERRLATLRALAAGINSVQAEDDLFPVLGQCLAGEPRDFPFALMYLFEPGAQSARLAGAHGLTPGSAAAPERLAVEGPTPPWPARALLAGAGPHLVGDLDVRFEDLPSGPWSIPPRSAMVVPIGRSAEPAGFLVLGLNPYRGFDAAYRGFVELLAGQISAAYARARILEEEKWLYTRARAEINQRIHTEEALRESEQRYRQLIHGLPAAVYATDGEGRITLFNETAVKLWGRTPELGREFWCGSLRAFRPDGSPLPVDEYPMVLAVKEGRAIRGAEIIIERPDGTRRSVLAHPQPIHDITGSVTGAVNMLVDITEQKRAAEALRESEEQFRTLTSNAPVGIFLTDLQGDTIFVNPAWCEMAGRPAEEIRGRGWLNAIHPADRAEVEQGWDRNVREGRPSGAEFRFQKPDGTTLWIHGNAVQLRDAHGEVIGYIGTVVDVTERREAEERARETAERLRFALDAGKLGDWSWDVGTDLVTFSDASADIYGADPSQPLTAAKLREMLVEEDRERAEAKLARAIAAHDIYDMEYRVRQPGGGLRWVAAKGRGTYAENGAILSMRGVMQDITERKLVETRLQRRNELLSLLSEAAHDMLSATDPGEMLRALFDKLSARLGLDVFFNFMLQDDRRGLRLDACGGVTPEVEQAFAQLDLGQSICGTVAQEARRIIVTDVQHCDYDKAAAVKRLGLRGYVCHPLMVGERLIGTLSFGSRTRDAFEPDELEFMQTIASYVAMAKERLRIEDERQAALKREQAAGLAKDRFLAVLSHELRTPLTPVLLTVAALESRPELPRDAREDLSMVRRNIELETKLIDDLLDVSRIASGKLRLRLETVDLGEAVQQVCAICEPQIREKGLRLHRAFDLVHAFVTADSARLQQALWNVLKNSVKFTPDGGDIYVTTTRPAPGYVRVEVRDTGLGMEAKVLPKIFDAFEQGDAAVTREFGGLGLGLAISRAIVELHQGTIRATSPGPRQGSVFTIDLPLSKHAPPAQSPLATPAPASGLVCLRVLLVEDHVDTARTLARLLSARGYVVEMAHTAQEALAIASRTKFDLIVSDIGLPDSTGFEVMKELSAKYRLPGIAMSGFGMEEDVQKSLEAGFSAHLVKPIELGQLLQAIRKAAGR